jgi:hypothetical protein
MAEMTAPAVERLRGALAWVWIGLLAQVAFAAGWVVAETWQGPRYSPLTDTISDLQAATAPHAWFPIVCFAAGGLGTRDHRSSVNESDDARMALVPLTPLDRTWP